MLADYTVREYVIKLTIYKKDIVKYNNTTLSYIPLHKISERIKIDKSSIFVSDMEGQTVPTRKQENGLYIEVDPPTFDSISVLVYFNSL